MPFFAKSSGPSVLDVIAPSAKGSVVVELSRELTEAVIPLTALLGALLGGVAVYEAMAFSSNDLAIAVSVLAHTVIGSLACGVIGLVLAARISAAQATEIQALYQAGCTEGQVFLGSRLFMLTVGAFAAYVVFIVCALTGSVIAAEAALPGSSFEVMDRVLLMRHPIEWILDAFVSAITGLGVAAAAMQSARQGANHHREISRTAGRSVSWGLLAVCVVQALYWLLRGLA